VTQGYAHRCTLRLTRYYGFDGDFRQRMLDFEKSLLSLSWKNGLSDDPAARAQSVEYMLASYYDQRPGMLVDSIPAPSGYNAPGLVLELRWAERQTKDLSSLEYTQHAPFYAGASISGRNSSKSRMRSRERSRTTATSSPSPSMAITSRIGSKRHYAHLRISRETLHQCGCARKEPVLCELWVNLGDGLAWIDQAASLWPASIPSVNLTPVISFGNWFWPSRRRHELCAVWIILKTMIMRASCERYSLARVVR
jgi:hypothetical protein